MLTHQKPVERARYFGSPLANVVENDGVPVFIHKCVAMIEGTGIKMVGLYRVSGKKEDCLTLQDKFDQGLCTRGRERGRGLTYLSTH